MKKRHFFRLRLSTGAAPFQRLSLCVCSLISFGTRTCKIFFFWVSAVSWQHKLAVCDIYVNCLGESCKLLDELVSLLTGCWMLRKCALESKSIWELTQRGTHCLVTHQEKWREVGIWLRPHSPSLWPCVRVGMECTFVQVHNIYFYIVSYCGFRRLYALVLKFQFNDHRAVWFRVSRILIPLITFSPRHHGDLTNPHRNAGPLEMNWVKQNFFVLWTKKCALLGSGTLFHISKVTFWGEIELIWTIFPRRNRLRWTWRSQRLIAKKQTPLRLAETGGAKGTL